MTITRGKIHKYPGTTIDYPFQGKLKFSVVVYIGKIINDIPEDMKWESATQAAHNIFDIAEDVTKLYQTDEDILDHFVVHLLYP